MYQNPLAPRPEKAVRRLFTVDDYEKLLQSGVLGSDEGLELSGGDVVIRETGQRRRFTVDEMFAMLEAGVVYEDSATQLVDGALMLSPAITPRHAHCRTRLNHLFHDIVPGDRAEWTSAAEVRVSDRTQMPSDGMLLRPRKVPYWDANPNPEDVLLLIRVADSDVDFVRRQQAIDERAGILEVLLFNLPASSVEVYSAPRSGMYTRYRPVDPEGILELTALPEVRIDVSDVLPAGYWGTEPVGGNPVAGNRL